MQTTSLDPSSRRALVVLPLVLSLLTMLGPLNIDTPLPAFVAMGREFGVSVTEMQLVVSVYMFGFGLMSIFHGPLSDALGRRPVILGGLAVYVVASIGAALSSSLTGVLVFRALQGLVAGAATIVARTVIRDVFTGIRAQQLMSLMAIVFSLAPAVAPIIGGALVGWGTWHWIFWFMAAFALVMVAATLLTLPETHPVEKRTPLKVAAILGSIGTVLSHGGFHRLAWACAMLFAGQFLYIGGASIFVVDLLGKGEHDFWILFVPMIVALSAGSLVSARAAGRLAAKATVNLGFVIAAAGTALGALLTALPFGDHPAAALVTPCAVALACGIAVPSLQIAVMDLFPERRGAATSGAMFCQQLFLAVMTVVMAPVLAHSTFAFSVSSLVCTVVGVALWVWHLRAGAGQDGARTAQNA
ncbi:multidrug effflux MFS transporter [Nocardioides yefusunii]|uniref:Multidrug effflux MFS transporter n=1 Tax=Nocardioides yefusunii TaxID=2500546 RepID=A0ABW1QYK1_9ACTN|nr:multidrug effflux MFS transporter [Nocardioides yefusunii]